ncbi:hypothetical protein FOL47_006043 [Perkinsus chesapeaki]|uniref:ATPase AAA-type core domain-containing protein n=1 Tax=Perkinsus chesapeaki TaxID=330153 RepID=A0A7J6LV08_PERCH|nr:hypothetical protein FOL47_006043 [Perkinsus chesapeaki]
MSNKSWQHRWATCMTELLEQIQIEHLPAEGREGGVAAPEVGFQPVALLYVKYLNIYTNIEDVYDQMIHPQKRTFIRQVMESVIIRVLELKEQLIFFNPRHKNRFIPLDEVLADLKMSPSVLEWRFPRCFTTDKHLADWLEIRVKRIQHWQKTFNLSRALDDLDSHADPFHKAIMIATWRREAQRQEEVVGESIEMGIFRKEQKLAQGLDIEELEEDSEELLALQRAAASRIAASWKRKVAMRHFQRMKQDEYVFLGMAPPNDQPAVDSVALAEEVRRQRRQQQLEADNDYDRALKDELAWTRSAKGEDIRSEMLEERRQWMLEVRKQTGAFPAEFDAFYTRFDQPAEAAEEAPAAGGGKKGKNDKKDAAGKKGGNKKGDKGAAEPEPVKTHDIGTSEVVQKLVELMKEYSSSWETRDESSNMHQRHDVNLTRSKVFPLVEKEIQDNVDELMRGELANLKNMYEKAKKKKEKKGKKGKGKKEKKSKAKKWCAAVGMVAHREDCLPELVQDGIIKCIKPAHLKDFLGEFAFLGALQRVSEPMCPPPSAQMIKSMIVEHVCLPLASTSIRQRCSSLTAKSLLLFGPKGCGKSLLARIIATEVGATFIDISPKIIEGKYTQPKIGAALLIYKAFLAAQDNAPAAIYCDDIDQVFQAVKKGKKKGKAAPATEGAPAGEEPASTSNPSGEGVDTKELLAAFDEKVWVPTPDFGTRVILWRSFMESKGVPPHIATSSDLNLTSLAHLSEGYTTRAIRQTVERVLTSRRIARLKHRPLTLHEFIEPLSRCECSWKEEYKKFQEFDYEASGDKARNLQMQEETKAMEASGGDKGGAKKKK